MKKHREGRQRGIALVAAIGFTFVVLALGAAMLGFTTSELKASQSQAQSVVARNAAEAGAELALNQWNHGGTPASVTGNVQGTVNGNTVTVGSYAVTCVLNATNNTLAISSSGTENGAPTGAPGQRIKVTASANTSNSDCMPFGQAGFAKNTILLSGSANTDSYNSSLGPYGGSNAGRTNGGLGSNSAAAGAITNTGDAHIKGKVVAGPNGNVNTSIVWPAWSRPNVTGGFGVASSPRALPDVPVPSGGLSFATVPVITTSAGKKGGTATIRPNGGTTLVPARTYDSLRNNYTWDIQAGTYILTGISLASDQNVVNIYGDVVFICHGDIVTGGLTQFNIYGTLKIIADNPNGNGIVTIGASFSTINPANPYQPSKVQILGTPNCKTVTWSGNNNYVGVIYAPSATVNLTASSNMYGAVVGNNIVMSGAGVIHYDEELGKLGLAGGTPGPLVYAVQTWEQD